MEYLIPIITVFITAIFITSSVAKLLDFEAAKQAAIDFGVPSSIAGIAMAFTICIEIAIAFTILFVKTGRPAAIAASILLFIFLMATARLVLLGRSPNCNCFGQLSSEPVGKSSLVRNAILLAFSLVLVFYPLKVQLAPGEFGPAALVFTIVVFSLTALLIASLLIALELRNNYGSVETRLQKMERYSTLLEMQDSGNEPSEGLPIGTMVPGAKLTAPDGSVLDLGQISRDGMPALILFVAPDCLPCDALAEFIPEWHKSLDKKVSLVLISGGDLETNIEKFGESNRDILYLQDKNEAADAVGAKWTPTAILIDSRARVASSPAAGDSAIKLLVEKIAETEDFSSPLYIGNEFDGLGPRFGQEVPDFELEYLEGGVFGKKDLMGRKTMVVFWSLTCQYCTEMVDEMGSWDADSGNFNLVIFADGAKEKLLATGVGSMIVADRDYEVSATMGMQGTPSAIIIDDKGVVVSETVQGSPQIALLSGGFFGGNSL